MEEKIEGKLDLRFEQFGDFQTRLRTELLSYRPEEIAGWGKTERKSFIDDAIASAASYRPYLKEPIEQYLQREAEIERWIDKHQGLNSESAKKVLAEAFETDGHPVPANIVNQIKPQRIRDGIALIVSPAVFRELIVKDMVQEGTKVSDPARIEQELSGYAEMGFLLDPGGLTKDLGLPEGIKLVAVQNTYSARTLRHEESEILAQNIIDALENPQVRKLDNLAAKHISGENFDRDTVRQILSDLAARVEEGALPDNLGGLGLTKEYAESHRQEAELVKTVWQKVSTAAKDESKETLANKIRGGLLVPENILINLGGNSGVGLLKGVEVKDNDFGLCLRSFKEGRFVYFRPTLKQGDELVHNNITYRIEDLISQGAQGVVYKAAAGGEVFAVKELFFPLATAATDPKLSPFFIDGLWKSQLSPTDLKKPFDEMIKQVDLYRFFKDLGDFADGLNGYEDSGNMGTEFRIKLDQLLAPRLGQVKTRDGIPIYKSGAMELVRFHPQQGGKVGLSPGQQKLILEETAAAAKQALAEIAGSTKGRALAQELTEAQERFIAESETLFGLADVEGVAGSRGIKIGGAVDPEDPGWQAVYMIQQWVEGQTLGKALALSEDTPKIWEYQKSVDFVRELLRTLRTLHQRKVIHKDLKPGNIMVDAKGQPVLVDFGIAKGRVASLSRSLRAGTTLVGTPGFAPEDLVTTGADARSDIYSLGMVLFTMLTGRDPSYQSGNPKDDVPVDPIMGEARLKKVAELLRRERDPSGNQKIPEALVSIVLKTVAPKPEDRFQTAEEMDGALSEIRIVSEDQHLDNLFKALDKQYQLPFYSRYPDGEQASGIMRRRSGGGIMIHGSFVDDLGREIGFHYDDDKIAPWPAEIKEYVEVVKKMAGDSTQLPKVLERIRNWSNWSLKQSTYPTFWRVLSEQLTEELKPKNRTVVSP